MTPACACSDVTLYLHAVELRNERRQRSVRGSESAGVYQSVCGGRELLLSLRRLPGGTTLTVLPALTESSSLRQQSADNSRLLQH